MYPFLQILQSLGVLDFHAAIFLAPTIVALWADSQLATGRWDGIPIGDQDLGLPKHSDSAFYQAEFDAANSNFVGRITVDNYEVIGGQLFVR